MLGLPNCIIRVGTLDLTVEGFVTAGFGAAAGIAKIDSHLTMNMFCSFAPPPTPRKRGSPRGPCDPTDPPTAPRRVEDAARHRHGRAAGRKPPISPGRGEGD